ncbi:MAG: A24 family peptidase [Lachnospiraceae bacterium]|nr:A24 family peptidase [Lachnospiraceae bacterium]
MAYLTLAVCAAAIPLCYAGIMGLQRSAFEKEENRKRKILRTVPEYLVMVLSETALVRLWWARGQSTVLDLVFLSMTVVIIGMSVLCMTDYWETVVPNRILLGMLAAFILILGVEATASFENVVSIFYSIVLGFVFTLIAFGLSYFVSRGNIGAGDIKLALVLGLMMTGEYVVGAVVYGCLASAAFSIVMLLRKKIGRKDKIPFVPFLYLGVIIRCWIG